MQKGSQPRFYRDVYRLTGTVSTGAAVSPRAVSAMRTEKSVVTSRKNYLLAVSVASM